MDDSYGIYAKGQLFIDNNHIIGRVKGETRQVTRERMENQKSSEIWCEEEKAPCFCEDIILQILYKLPHESLVRFCLVSKSWLDMIANPARSNSCYSYLLKSYENLTILGLFYHKTEPNAQSIDWESLAISKQPQYSPPPPILRDSTLSLLNNGCMMLKDSSNGFLLCQRIQEGCDSDSDSCDADIWLPHPHYYCVFNPLTQQRVDLPVLDKPRSDSSVAFDCSMQDSPFSPVRFTVVLIDSNTHPNRPGYEIKLFSYDQVQWSEFRLLSWNLKERMFSLGSFPGGVIHRPSEDEFHWLCDNYDYLVMFKREKKKHTLRYGELPEQYIPHSDGYNYQALSVFESHLYYGLQNQDNQVILVFLYSIHIWELEHVVCLRKLKKRCLAILKVTPLLSEAQEEEEEESVYFKGFHPNKPEIIFLIFKGKLFSYDVKSLQRWFIRPQTNT